MKGQSNRLEPDRQPALAGSAIDRSRPLRFRLDGRQILGFAGDSVLSAALASGVDTVGEADGRPIGLSARFAPPVRFGRGADAPALPMGRMPAIDGAELQSLGPRARRRHWLDFVPFLGGGRRSLRLDLDRGALGAPWADQAAQGSISTAVIVVGGGVAGMAAALEVAQSGAEVCLIEAAPMLGGSARYFGSQEGDESPDQTIARLAAAIAGTDAIRVFLGAEAQSVRRGRVRVHRVRAEGNAVRAEIVDFVAPRIILATGAIERLPVFPGNRLPRVTTTLEAYLLAERHGVWIGQSAMLATVHGAAYRLPMLLSEAGIATRKIADSRPSPQSRFIEYAKAYGITQTGGTIVGRAEPAAKGRGLAVTLQLAMAGYSHEDAPVATDCLLVCGGWQPELTLWHMAGGMSRWSAGRHRIEAQEEIAGLALAGSAAGWFSKHACLLSGQHAVEALFGRRRTPVVELAIDPIYETPDDPAPVLKRDPAALQAGYLDAGSNLIQPPARRSAPRRGWRLFPPAESTWSLADRPQALGLADVAAGVQLGAIPAASAGIVAQERSVAPGHLVEAARALQPPSPMTEPAVIPSYLAGRFGPAPQLWVIAPDEPRTLAPGALIFLNSDQTDPRLAIGIVVGAALALIGKPVQPEDRAILRDQGRAVAIRLVEPAAGASAPAFSSAAGAP